MDGMTLGRFGDKRLECVGGALLASMRRKRTLCPHRLARDRNQARQFSQFLANSAVPPHEMLVTAARRTNRRAAARHALALMDTADLLFSTHDASKSGFGMGGDNKHPGLFLHPAVAADADNGGILGLVDRTVLNRTDGKVSNRKKRLAEEKESHRWLAGAGIAGDSLPDAAMITVAAGAESDIHHLFARGPVNVHLLCRSGQPRTLATGELPPEYCAALPEQARETIGVPGKGSQAGPPGGRGDPLRRGEPEAAGEFSGQGPA